MKCLIKKRRSHLPSELIENKTKKRIFKTIPLASKLSLLQIK